MCRALRTGSLFVYIAILTAFASAPQLASAAGDEVNVTATPDANEIDPNDAVTLTIVATSTSDSKVRLPDLSELSSGPLASFSVRDGGGDSGVRTQMTMSGGGIKRESIYTETHRYQLRPKGAGSLRVGGIEVSVGDATIVTKPFTIRVAAGLSRPGSGRGGRGQPQQRQLPQAAPGDEDDEDLFALLLRRQGLPIPPGFGGALGGGGGASQPGSSGFRTQPINPQEAFFVQVDVDKAEAYAGEQVTASWYLFTRGQIRDLDTLKYPSLHGFWKEDIEISTRLNFTSETLNGIPYKKALLASFALFPIKEGSAIVDPYTAKCSVLAFDDPFGAFSGKAYSYSKSSNSVKITIKPLPSEGRPASFSGAVGEYQVTARVEDPKVIAGQLFSLKLRFEGRGNAKLIEMPPFDPPEGMEVYDTQKDSKFFRTGTSYKDFTILLIPRRAGSFVLPAISASIFDPAQKKYVEKRTEPISIVVQPAAPGTAPTAQLALQGLEKKIDPQSAAPVLDSQIRLGSSTPYLGYALAAGFVFAFGALATRARIKLGWGRRKDDSRRRLRARFKKIEPLLEKSNWRAVGREATNTVYWALGAASGQGGANVQIEKLLMRAPPSVRRELGDEIAKAMEKFQALAFAPEGAVGALKEQATLAALLKSTEELLLRAVALAESDGRSSLSG